LHEPARPALRSISEISSSESPPSYPYRHGPEDVLG
jgi:hypothetical protein